MRYWWVNHKKTSKFEVAGGFLWSPMRKRNGARNQFYDNMRVALPGDIVISYSYGEIRYVGVVNSFAVPSLKPPSFGAAGEYWNEQGWLLGVEWQTLSRPVIPKERISEFRGMLPPKYSPVHPATGHGRQNAYLAEVSKRIFEVLMGQIDLQSIGSTDVSLDLTSDIVAGIEDHIERQIREDKSLDDTVRSTLVAARRGQGVFRQRIYEFEKGCRLTLVSTPDLLIASHIKPWRVCSTASERLDGANGLLLTPHVDHLFDRGLVSFEVNGRLLVSSRLHPSDLGRLGLNNCSGQNFGAFDSRQEKYLSFHRERLFIP